MVEIIAEIGNTHEGSLELAKCFIHTVSKCGVDAVKFQFHIFEEESLNTAPNPPYFQNESRQEYFSRTSFSQNQWSELRSFSKDLGLKFYCSPFSILAAGSTLIAIGTMTNAVGKLSEEDFETFALINTGRVAMVCFTGLIGAAIVGV